MSLTLLLHTTLSYPPRSTTITTDASSFSSSTTAEASTLVVPPPLSVGVPGQVCSPPEYRSIRQQQREDGDGERVNPPLVASSCSTIVSGSPSSQLAQQVKMEEEVEQHMLNSQCVTPAAAKHEQQLNEDVSSQQQQVVLDETHVPGTYLVYVPVSLLLPHQQYVQQQQLQHYYNSTYYYHLYMSNNNNNELPSTPLSQYQQQLNTTTSSPVHQPHSADDTHVYSNGTTHASVTENRAAQHYQSYSRTPLTHGRL